jgi:N-acetylmuramoyl-L-alanine amidase
LFVSLHFNDSTTGSGDGVETFYAQQKATFSDGGWTFVGLIQGKPEPVPMDQGASFAEAIQASVVAQLGVTDRGAKPRQLAVVRLTRCPAALVEGGFINNAAEARKLASEEYRERLAAAVSDGVVLYYQGTGNGTSEPRVGREVGVATTAIIGSQLHPHHPRE